MRRIFDVCHGCRRCFSFCDSFPILFEEIDKSPTEELDSVPTSAFKGVSDKCTACDRCYVDCPYQVKKKRGVLAVFFDVYTAPSRF